MAKLLMLKGLPASGKSTFAKGLLTTGQYHVRVNKDDLRSMLHLGKHSDSNESLILEVRNTIVNSALGRGQNVVVDDTNLAPKHEKVLKQIADKHKADFEVSFFDVNREECIRRDAARDNPVGASVIDRMHRQYLKKWVDSTPPNVYNPPMNKPTAAIFDVDGTLVLRVTNRSPFDWKRVKEDAPNVPVIAMAQAMASQGHTIIVMSGRDSICRVDTIEHLTELNVPVNPDFTFMRPEGDNRKDAIVKKELFEKFVKDRFHVVAVFDDRPQVCRVWWEMGLPLFKVGDPDANF